MGKTKKLLFLPKSDFIPGTTEYATKKSASAGILCIEILGSTSISPLASATFNSVPSSNSVPLQALNIFNKMLLKVDQLCK